MSLQIYDLSLGSSEFELSGDHLGGPDLVTLNHPNEANVSALFFELVGAEERNELVEKSSSNTKRIDAGVEYWVGYVLKVPDSGFSNTSFCVLGFQTHTDVSAGNSPVNEVRIKGNGTVIAASNPSLPSDAEEIDVTSYFTNGAYVSHVWQIINSTGSDSLARLWLNGTLAGEWLTAGSLNPADGDKTYLKWGIYGSQGPAPIEIHLVKEIRVFVGTNGYNQVEVTFGAQSGNTLARMIKFGGIYPKFGDIIGRLPAPAPPFDILNYSPLLWLDAQDYSTITEAGTITQWDDKSGNDNHVTASVAPVYEATGFEGTFPCATFNADTMSVPALSASANDFVFIMVIDSDFPTGFKPIFDSQNTGRLIIDVDNISGKYRVHENGNSRLSTNVHIDGPQILQYHVADPGEFFINGESDGTFTGYVQLGITTPARIGSKYDGNGSFRWEGKLCEFIVLPGTLGQDDIDKFNGHLAHKWGIESLLDAGHPYKNNPPA